MHSTESPPMKAKQAEPELATAATISETELGQQTLLDSADLAVVGPLLKNCPTKTLAAGEVLVHAGRPNEHLYLVLSGRVSVRLASAETTPIAEIGAGESVAELSVIDGQPTSACVVAEEDTRVLGIDEELLWILVQSSHAIAGNLLFTLTRRLRVGNQVIFEGRERYEQYRFHATVDALTGLFNRHWLNSMLPRQMYRAHLCERPFCLLMIDIDYFKQYNDEHGHVAGDRALGAVAQALQTCLRPTDMAARYGGEEFIVLLVDCPEDAAKTVAERVRTTVASTKIAFAQGAELPSVTVSVGVAEMTETETLESFIASADAALYRAKETGRNRVST
ncbi:MAG: GGDEF domain-containing protein [Gammaproteobacteria bacterium]|nr:GGDEF domain-containing protein [Gammaproteobacteria bacterium]